MKDPIKNDDAVSVVVGSILVLAVLVTFMSVVTSSWVPVYEGNAESDHSDQTYKTFMDLHKQIEFADEFSRSTAIELGTDEMPFMKNTNSVGYLEVNGSDGAMFITANLTTDAASSDVGYGLSVAGMDTNQTNPITNFSFDFTQINFTNRNETTYLNPGFRIQMRTSTLNRWITLFATGIGGGNIETEIEYSQKHGGKTRQVTSEWTNYYATILGIRFTCGLNPKEKWVGFSYTNQPDGIFVNNLTVSVNMRSDINMTLIEPEGQNVTINGVEYNTSTNTNVTSLSNLTQHYMRQPGDGTGGDYYIDYVQYIGVDEGTQIFTYNTTQDSAYLVTENGEMITVLDKFKAGGGTLSLESDYNFMVDQSYIYDSGAVILKQYDGAVFKDDRPITVSKNSNGDLILIVKTTVLQGDYQAGGNGIETIRTQLANSELIASGFTDEITITKDTTSEVLYDLWYSYFSDLEEYVNTSTTANCTDISNESINQVGVIINSTSENILLTVNRKEIIVT